MASRLMRLLLALALLAPGLALAQSSAGKVGPLRIETLPNAPLLGSTLGSGLDPVAVGGGLNLSSHTLSANLLSVAGRTGAVTLTSGDLPDFAASASAASPVQSVFGRTGSVTLGSSDVTGALGYTPLRPSNNLSDTPNAAAARTNLGLGGAATLNVGTATGTVAAGDDSRITGGAQKASNLSDLSSAATARTNLLTGGVGSGLNLSGGSISINFGSTAGTAAQGNDSRITGAAQVANNLSDLVSAAAARTNLGLGSLATQNANAAAITGGSIAGTQINYQVTARTVHDEIIGTDGVITAGSCAFSSSSASFQALDVGKAFVLNGAGAAGADLITTISAVTDSNHAVLSNCATYTTPWWTVGRAYHASTTDVSASYSIGDTLTLVGGTPVAGATGVFTIQSLEVSTASVNAGGSGGANGACTVMGTTGVTRTTWGPATVNGGATQITSANGWFTATGTVSGGVLTGPLTIVQPGDYSTAPTVQSAEPVVPISGCAGLTGATVSLKMGPHMLKQTTPGHYTALPANPVATTTNGSGAGATLTLWGLSPAGYSLTTQGDQVGGYWAYGTDDTAAINQAIAATQAMNGGTVVLPAGRSLMLGAFNIPYVGTSPPIQPPLEIVGAGNLQPMTAAGGYISPYLAGATGSIIDNRYAGGDAAGHVAKLDTRGMGIIRPHSWSLVDWGTDNFLMFLTTNTWPIIRDMTFMGNPTCYQMTCQQNVIRLGGIDGSRTFSGILPTDGYQANSPTVADSFFEFVQEGIQFGSAANSGTFVNIQSGSTNGSWGTGFYHFYGAGAGTGNNNIFGGLSEMFGYPYIVYMDHVNNTNAQNNFYGLVTFDGSGLRNGKNGVPTLAAFYFDSSSSYNKVDTSPENDVKYNFVVQQGTTLNTIITPSISPASYFANPIVAAKMGIGLPYGVNPTWALDVGPGTGGVSSRINGGNTNSADGPCFRIAAASADKIMIGTNSGCLGGTADTTGVINAGGTGKLKFKSFNVDTFTLDNGFMSMQAPIQLMNYTVATLPTCNTSAKGRRAYVTDANAPTYGSTLVGSGTVVAPAFCDGTNWVAR